MKPNLDNPVVDERKDGTYLYFTPLPPILLKHPPVIIDRTPPDQNQTTD